MNSSATVYSQTHIDPMVGFRNSQGESVRGTIVNLQRKSLVMEVYNPYSIVQVSEVLNDLVVRLGSKNAAYMGKAVVTNIVNTGLTAVVSVTLTDEWRELSALSTPGSIGEEARAFVRTWSDRFQIRRDYQIVVNELAGFLSEVSRWVAQVDLSDALPKEHGRLREDYFCELAMPLIDKTKAYLDRLEHEASLVDEEQASAHHAFAQPSLHPPLLRGQIVNVAFLQVAVAAAHRNRIDLLVNFLKRTADAAREAGRSFRVLNVGCGPAVEIQRFLQSYSHPEALSFELVDFSEETLAWTRERLSSIMESTGRRIAINYVHDSVHQMIKRHVYSGVDDRREFDAVYCAGLFDYLLDKVCAHLLSHFATRMRPGGKLLVTNVHACDAERLFAMEHLLEWHLIYRDVTGIDSILPKEAHARSIYVDATGINLFAEMAVA